MSEARKNFFSVGRVKGGCGEETLISKMRQWKDR